MIVNMHPASWVLICIMLHLQYAAEEAARRAEREREEAERRKREKAEKAARAAAFEEADWIKASEAEAAALLVGAPACLGKHEAGFLVWIGSLAACRRVSSSCCPCWTSDTCCRV
jgi:hypothetical protein